jgi:hypothetical protein
MAAKHTLCDKSELDLFNGSYFQTNVTKCEEICVKPSNTLDNSNTIDFRVISSPEAYKDLSSTTLRVKIQLTKQDDTLYTSADVIQPGTVTNIMNSLFSSVAIYLAGKLVCTISDFHYLSYLSHVMSYTDDSVKSFRGDLVGFNLDTSGQFDSLTQNLGLTARKNWVKNSSVLELMGRVHGSIFNTTRYLPSSIEIRFVFTLAKSEFVLMEPETATSKVKILDAALYINQLTINDKILLKHRQAILTNNVILPFQHLEIKTFTIPSGNSSIMLENLIIGRLPNLIAVAFCDNASYTGRRSKNPYNFKNLSMSSFNLHVNHQRVPNESLEMDFSKDPPQSARAYWTLFNALNINDFDRGILITQKLFNNGCFILAFDLTSDHSHSNGCSSLLNEGSVRLEARLSTPLAETTTCLVLAQYDSYIQIDRTMNVTTNI